MLVTLKRFEQKVRAPAADVTSYLTEPELVKRWRFAAAKVNPAEGGGFQIEYHNPRKGDYTEIYSVTSQTDDAVTVETDAAGAVFTEQYQLTSAGKSTLVQCSLVREVSVLMLPLTFMPLRWFWLGYKKALFRFNVLRLAAALEARPPRRAE